jgi:hypothetical protein
MDLSITTRSAGYRWGAGAGSSRWSCRSWKGKVQSGPNLLAKFKTLGFTFEVAHKNTEIKDEKNKVFVEVDAFLQNGDKVMIVEIKATLRTRDVDDHIARMEKLRKYADLHNDRRKYLGAVAGAVTRDAVKDYALKKGFFVVIPSGDTFNIIKPEGKYHVKEW